MNEFLMLMWLGDVVNKLSFVCALTSMIGLVSMVFYICAYSDRSITKEMRDKLMYRAAIIALVCGVIAVIMPSKQTIYIAAAASATGSVLETESGKKLLAAFNKKVDDYVKGDGE